MFSPRDQAPRSGLKVTPFRDHVFDITVVSKRPCYWVSPTGAFLIGIGAGLAVAPDSAHEVNGHGTDRVIGTHVLEGIGRPHQPNMNVPTTKKSYILLHTLIV
jgi:hypothetical protein